MRSPNSPQVSSFADAEKARRAHEDCIVELQKLPGAGLRVIAGIELADGTARPIAHKLGRAPLWVQASCVRGAVSSGRIEEVRSTNDRTQIVVLKATGYGATVTVDVAIL